MRADRAQARILAYSAFDEPESAIDAA